MKRRTSSKPVRVHSYGCRAPTVNAERVDEQYRLARGYKNKLTEIELERRRRYRELTAKDDRIAPAAALVEALETQLAESVAHLKLARKEARRRVELKSVRDDILRTRAALSDARAKRKALRGELKGDSVLRAATDALQREINQKIKDARASCGVYWGTYLLIEAAAEQAAKSSTDPVFCRWDGSGRIGVQIQGGASAEDVLHGRCTQLQIDALPATTWDTRSGRRAARTEVRLRIGSEGRAPIWAHFPVILHRPLPADATIKGAWITRRRRGGTRIDYRLQIVLEAESLTRSVQPQAPVAAINLGFRARPDGVRVGYLVDEFGDGREIVLPGELLGRIDYADHIRSIRDDNLERFRPQLVAELAPLVPEAPEWLQLEFKTVALWRSAARFSAFVRRWSGERIAGDEIVFQFAEAWRRKDRHLLQWESSQRERAFGHRREIYRLLAAEFARCYSTIVVEQLDLRNIARTARPEHDDALHQAARKNRTRVALSELRLCVAQRVPIVAVPAAGITHTCHECGSVESFDAAVHLTHTCTACGETWDQDRNAAKNLLRRYRERGPDGASPGPARNSENTSDRGDVRDDGGASRGGRAARLNA